MRLSIQGEAPLTLAGKKGQAEGELGGVQPPCRVFLDACARGVPSLLFQVSVYSERIARYENTDGPLAVDPGPAYRPGPALRPAVSQHELLTPCQPVTGFGALRENLCLCLRSVAAEVILHDALDRGQRGEALAHGPVARVD